MNPLHTTMLRSAICAAIAFGAVDGARADSFAQAILVIDNLRLLHANGTAYNASDFAMLTGTADAYAAGRLDRTLASAGASGDLRSGRGLDVARQHAGAGLAGREENNFAPFQGTPASFGYGDQRMAGNMITTTMGAAGAQLQTRADASLAAAGTADGHGAMAGSAAFSFSLGAGEYMTIALDATPFTHAYATEGSGAGAQAHLAWSISLLDLTTGATVFSFQPEQLNELSAVSRSDGAGSSTIYNPGRLSFAATTGMLNAGDTYQITFAQASFAGALQSQQVPEPAVVALCGAGLLAMAALGWRRRDGQS